jgi:membrane protein DedA with SNARE-associated domain
VAIALLGWTIGEAAQQLIGHLKRYERTVMAAIIAVGAVLWLWHTLRARAAARRT